MQLWPKPTNTPPIEEGGDQKPPEKSIAEQIAEGMALAMKPLNEAIAAQNERFNKIEEQTKPREPKPHVDPQEPTSVLDDENLAFAQRMTPLLARQLELESRIVRNDVKVEYDKAGYGELWEQFETEINNMIESAPLATNDGKPLRGDPQYVRNVVDVILGRAARKAGMRFSGKTKGFFLESANGSAENTSIGPADGLTDNQRKVMSRMGIPLDKAKDVIKKLHFV